jgi:hypothetical protein
MLVSVDFSTFGCFVFFQFCSIFLSVVTTMVKPKVFHIAYNSPDGVYVPGSLISGSFLLCITYHRGVHLTSFGQAK